MDIDQQLKQYAYDVANGNVINLPFNDLHTVSDLVSKIIIGYLSAPEAIQMAIRLTGVNAGDVPMYDKCVWVNAVQQVVKQDLDNLLSMMGTAKNATAQDKE